MNSSNFDLFEICGVAGMKYFQIAVLLSKKTQNKMLVMA